MTQPDYISGVMVTGPQRSGTRIASKILAQEMHLPWVPEEAIDFRNWRKLLWRLIDGPCCVQCPALSHRCHELPSNVLVVFMIRDVADIIASQKRIGWAGKDEADERASYWKAGWEPRGIPIAELKYLVWRHWQRERTARYMELQYESLRHHKLWLPKAQRVNFGSHQTEVLDVASDTPSPLCEFPSP